MLAVQRVSQDNDYHVQITNQGDLLPAVPPGEIVSIAAGLDGPSLAAAGIVIPIAADTVLPGIF